MRCMRSSDSPISPGPATQPRTSPVSPPMGTTGWPAAWQAASTRDTCSVFAGRTIASAWQGL